MTKIAVLGSTGSIGTQTLDIVSKNEDLQVVGLAAGRNIDLLEKQIRAFRPGLAAVGDPALAKELEIRVKDTGCTVAGGMEGLIQVAVMEEAEILVTAIVGMIGIRPTIEAICAGKDIALANKETLVTAGHIIMPLAEEKGVKIYPVDSEHSAIYQCLHGEKNRSIQKLLITASGGPFRGKKREDLEHVRVEDALKHPNWAMGHKITIDSATLVNKGLEVMEAKWLFGVDLDQIQVVVQPQSVIHSMVEFVDGSVMAQLGSPDMRLPIQLAMTYPERQPCPVEPLNLLTCGSLTFQAPDMEAFPCLALARECAARGGNSCAAMNGANEEAVALYLQDKIGFYDIYELVRRGVEAVPLVENPTLEEILAADALARKTVRSCRTLKFL